MKLQLGLAAVDLPNGSELKPAVMLLVGKTDKAAALSAGPTMAKTQTNEYQRTVAMSFSPFPTDADPDDALNFGLNELQKKTAGKVANVKDVTIAGRPGRTVEFRYRQPATKVPVVTRAYLVLAVGCLHSFVLTALDNAKTLPGAIEEFDALVNSLSLD